MIILKVKIFDESHENDLENSINEFIIDKEVIDIKYGVSISMFGEEQIYCFSALIMYKWIIYFDYSFLLKKKLTLSKLYHVHVIVV